MTELEKLIETADRLSKSLEQAADNEKKHCFALCSELEHYSWELNRISNNIKELKLTFGG